MRRQPVLSCGALRLPRKRHMRNRAFRLTLHRLQPSLAAFRRTLLGRHRILFTSPRILNGFLPRLRARGPRIGSAQRNTSPPRLAQSNSNRPLRRSSTVLPSRTRSISSRTNSPAAVEGYLPSARSRFAASTVSFSVIIMSSFSYLDARRTSHVRLVQMSSWRFCDRPLSGRP
jgi:hypothetical protein